jgi:thiosulfate/3-mercaptopyruvate sulfurtransferase
MTVISVEELRSRLTQLDLRIVDTRWYLGRPGAGREAYEAGHIPGAMFLDLDTDLSTPKGPGRHPLPSARAFARRLGGLGIGADHLVVA